MIKYKIVEVDQVQHSIVVRYYSDEISEEILATDVLDGVIRRCRTDYNIDLPVPVPAGEELAAFIESRAPIDWLFKLAQLEVTDTSADTTALTNLIGVEHSFAAVPTTITGYAPNDAALTLKIKEVVTELLQGNI